MSGAATNSGRGARSPGRVQGALAALALLVALTGCASGPARNGDQTGHPDDPWEGVNRVTFAFNDEVDRLVLKPVARGYEAVAPVPVRAGVANFFDNLGDLWIGVNNLLQAKPVDAAADVGRFLINSTVGVFGLIDVASAMGIPKHTEDFGQTLAVWGVEGGPYVVLPFLGPRMLRDAGALVVDFSADVLNEVDPVRTRNALRGTRVIDVRAELLPAEKVIEEAALDRYGYLRSAYMQRRRHLIFDGNPPREVIPED